jgi:hypothetical protein
MMMINKQIVLDLLFEHYRTTLNCIYIDEISQGNVVFDNDICLNGGNVFDIVFKILGIELNEVNYQRYHTPFLNIVERRPITTDAVNKELLVYFNWIVQDSKFWKELT